MSHLAIRLLVLASLLLAPLATLQVAAETVPAAISVSASGIPIDPTGIEGAETLVNPVDGSRHVVWSDPADGTLWHTARVGLGGWTTPERVAAGSEFDAEFSQTGALHVVFAHDFDNWDIFHAFKSYGAMAWELPTPVSRTDGESRYPKISIDGKTIHATWTDKTPGYWTVYYGKYTSDQVVAAAAVGIRNATLQPLVVTPTDIWSSVPVPNGNYGLVPVIMARYGDVFVGWESGREVYLTGKHGDAQWQLPFEVSYGGTSGVSREPRLYVRPCSVSGVRVVWFAGDVSRYRDSWFFYDRMYLSPSGSYPTDPPTPSCRREFFPAILG